MPRSAGNRRVVAMTNDPGPLNVLISGGFNGAYDRLLPEFERTSGIKVLPLWLTGKTGIALPPGQCACVAGGSFSQQNSLLSRQNSLQQFDQRAGRRNVRAVADV